ncbi:MAG: NADH-quinone oxidoreductase subunit N [Gammaproteobacteria bacterium]|nr:MAG: NADH-quinone oxidoreductase subunit N [Gammaproteobacteria bacterium]UTW42504.1 NADH-quinone oxidoreductase subunit N [bacterium SCSIO 12844]
MGLDSLQTWVALIPEIVLAIMILIILLADIFLAKFCSHIAYGLSQLTLIAVFIVSWIFIQDDISGTFLNGQLHVSSLSLLLSMVVYICNFLVFVYSRKYIEDHDMMKLEYYLLSLLSTLGAVVLIKSMSLITVFIGLELLSLPLYAMIGMRRGYAQGGEASIKYFVTGAVATAVLLYGMSFVYGLTGSLDIQTIALKLAQASSQYQLIILFSMVFFILAFAFKLGAAPFHMWLPDVYDGSPNAVTAYLASVPKVAGYAMLVILMHDLMRSFSQYWSEILMIMGILSIVIGNTAALVQKNLKRMIGYSTIAHVGFVFLALSVDTDGSMSLGSALYYMIVYVINAVAVFGIIMILSKSGFEAENLNDFAGLNQRNSWLAFLMLILFLSLAGIPPLAGFTIKLLVINTLEHAGAYYLAVFALIMSVVGAFYYLRVIRVVYFEKPTLTEAVPVRFDAQIAVSINCVAILFFGIAPYYTMNLIRLIYQY